MIWTRSLYANSLGIIHRSACSGRVANGSVFTSPFSMACRSKEIDHEPVEKKPEAVRPELDFNPIREVFFSTGSRAISFDLQPMDYMLVKHLSSAAGFVYALLWIIH